MPVYIVRESVWVSRVSLNIVSRVSPVPLVPISLRTIFPIFVFRTLQWRVHGPTSFSLTRYLLYLLPLNAIPMDARFDVLELSRFLTELSVMDFFFVPYRPSVVALAALLNAMEDIPTVPNSAGLALTAQIKQCTSMDSYSMEVNECRARLRVHYQQGGYSRPVHAVVPAQEDRDTTISPVCVNHGIVGYQHETVSKDIRASKNSGSHNYVSY
eukprot:scaffold4554_cov178-Amphora_coffeaeformis.AAC.3